MTRRILFTLLLSLLLFPVCISHAQEKDSPSTGPQNLYHVKLIVKELESGKVINGREYDTNLTTVQGKAITYTNSIRTGNKIPITTGSTAASNSVNTMYTYIDVGVNFDIRDYRVDGDKASFTLKAEITNVEAASNSILQPVIHQNSWNSNVRVTMGKPTIVFSSDDVSSKRTTQVEVTATEIK
ncbi:hypothetical protein [Terriglobus tenax]|uniref:hypothetical protein n=1 Tax=Terriglobus tenax TaxID=1111115 RepID=UPI0021E02BAF|nr:hypothetical protein [Terriglobus tenax]